MLLFLLTAFRWQWRLTIALNKYFDHWGQKIQVHHNNLNRQWTSVATDHGNNLNSSLRGGSQTFVFRWIYKWQRHCYKAAINVLDRYLIYKWFALLRAPSLELILFSSSLNSPPSHPRPLRFNSSDKDGFSKKMNQQNQKFLIPFRAPTYSIQIGFWRHRVLLVSRFWANLP